jgi:hypothetical protein
VKLRLSWEDTEVSGVVVTLDRTKARLELACVSPEATVAVRALEAPLRERLRAEGFALQDFRATCDGDGAREQYPEARRWWVQGLERPTQSAADARTTGARARAVSAGAVTGGRLDVLV